MVAVTSSMGHSHLANDDTLEEKIGGSMKFLLILLLCITGTALADTRTSQDEAIIQALINDYRTTKSTASILFWTPEQRRVGFRELGRINPTREIKRGEQVFELPETLKTSAR